MLLSRELDQSSTPLQKINQVLGRRLQLKLPSHVYNNQIQAGVEQTSVLYDTNDDGETLNASMVVKEGTVLRYIAVLLPLVLTSCWTNCWVIDGLRRCDAPVTSLKCYETKIGIIGYGISHKICARFFLYFLLLCSDYQFIVDSCGLCSYMRMIDHHQWSIIARIIWANRPI